MAKLTWTPAKVGCYWYAGVFCIGTYQTGTVAKPFPSSGYELTKMGGHSLGCYPTLEAAKQAAEALAK